MSSHRVELTPLAIQDVVSAAQWIAVKNPPAAARWLDLTETQIQSLNLFPDRCPLAPEAKDVGSDVLQLVIGKRRGRYRVLFRIKGSVVQVLRVVHGMREHLTADELAESGW